MKLLIDIPEEFEQHFQADRFEDGLLRLSADAHLLAGLYEQETALMLCEAFATAIPAADVVEVVRCRECENWDTDWVPSHAGEGQYFCPILGQVTDTDFYCGCGKRKDGGQNE